MGIAPPKERLSHLLELAGQGPAARAALLGELADLLLDWPCDYAQAMRAPFEALLEKVAREVDAPARAALAERLAGHDEIPVALLNELFLEAPKEFRARILARNAALGADTPRETADGRALVAAARTTVNGAFADTFAAMLALPRATASDILHDETGQSLAVACKGAGLDRAAFSAIALISAGSADAAGRLGAYDDIPSAAAERLTRFWRARL